MSKLARSFPIETLSNPERKPMTETLNNKFVAPIARLLQLAHAEQIDPARVMREAYEQFRSAGGRELPEDALTSAAREAFIILKIAAEVERALAEEDGENAPGGIDGSGSTPHRDDAELFERTAARLDVALLDFPKGEQP